ncbi:hypothetical protein JTB14_001424 [Gonioctena quinquepunctata]|nr:hypothetical protein JTB14_001424 [Gonioctena quinquepunctata]
MIIDVGVYNFYRLIYLRIFGIQWTDGEFYPGAIIYVRDTMEELRKVVEKKRVVFRNKELLLSDASESDIEVDDDDHKKKKRITSNNINPSEICRPALCATKLSAIHDIYAFFLNNRGYSKLEIERELKHVNNYLASKISDLNRLPRVKKTNPTLDIIGNEEVSDDQVGASSAIG